MPSFRELLARPSREIREIDPADGRGAPRRRDVPRRARAGRVRAGHDPRRGLHPARPPREPGREQARRPRRARSSSTARAAPARRSRPRRCRSSATPTSSRWPAASAAGRTRAGRGSRPPCSTPSSATATSRHILLPEVGEAGQQKLLESQGAAARRRRPRLAGRALPRGRGRRHARHRRHGRRRRVEPAAPDPPQHGPHRRAQGRLGEEDAHRAQPRRRRRHLRRALRRRQRARHHRRLRRRSSTAPTTSRRATCSTTRRC